MQGKIGVVTGAGSGIGKASALEFSRQGAIVVVSDIDPGKGNQTVEEIRSLGGEAIFIACDISQEEHVRALVAEINATYGRLDFAHNNAGITPERADLADTASQNWEKVIQVNLLGTYYCLKHEIQLMLKNGGGTIVNTSSGLGLEGSRKASAYVASKWALNGLTKSAALEYGRQNTRINAICPGFTKTELADAFVQGNPDGYEELLNSFPSGQAALPEDQARAAVWLCSDQSLQISGVTLAVDGGYSAGKMY